MPDDIIKFEENPMVCKSLIRTCNFMELNTCKYLFSYAEILQACRPHLSKEYKFLGLMIDLIKEVNESN